MKKFAFFLFCTLLFAAPCADAQTHFVQGRSLLFAGGELTASNAVSAKLEFEEAVAENPLDPMANLFLAACRLFALFDNNAQFSPGPPIENVRELLDGFGVGSAGRDLFDWTADFPQDPGGNIRPPASCPNGAEVQSFLQTLILPEINESLQNLSVVEAGILFSIYPVETGLTNNIEVDDGDVLMFRAMLHAAKAAVLMLSSYNVNVDIYRIAEKIVSDVFHPNTDLLDRYTDFLKRFDTCGPRMLEAKNETVYAIENYLSASEFIRSEADDQQDDLVAIAAEEAADEEQFRIQISEVKDSIQNYRVAVLELENAAGQGHIDFHHIFGTEQSSAPHFRNFFPLFDDSSHIHTRTFPDTTFGGILPDCVDELSLVEFTPFRLPIVFPIFRKTMVMDGQADDWQTVYPILPPYFEESWSSSNWSIEYVKVAADDDFFYWMIKLQEKAIDHGGYFYFHLWDEKNSWNYINISIWGDLTYIAYNWSKNIYYTGTRTDFGMDGIVEGRVPRSYVELDGIFSASAYTYLWNSEASDWHSASLYGESILTASKSPIADAGSDQIVVDSVTLNGKSIYPDRPITSWQWSLRHTSDPSYNRTATGPNPTITDLATGFYEVILTATDSLGQTSTDTMMLAVIGSGDMITRQECDQEVLGEKRRWIGLDEKVGLEEAIKALQVVSGIREE